MKDVEGTTKCSLKIPANKRKAPETKSESPSTSTALMIRSSCKENTISLVSLEDELSNSNTSVQVTSITKEKTELPVKSKMVLNDVKVCLVDIGNKLHRSNPILVNNVATDVEPDIETYTVPANKDSKVATYSQSVEKLSKSTNKSLPTHKSSEPVVIPVSSDKISETKNDLPAVEKKSKSMNKPVPTKKSSEPVVISISSGKISETKDDLPAAEKKSKPMNKSLPTEKSLKPVLIAVASDKIPKTQNDVHAVEKKSNPAMIDKTSKIMNELQSVEQRSTHKKETVSNERLSKCPVQSQRIEKTCSLKSFVDESNAPRSTNTMTAGRDEHDKLPISTKLSVKPIESNNLQMTETIGVSKKQPESTENEVTNNYTANRDEVLSEVLKELAFLRSKTHSPISSNSSLSLSTQSMSTTSIPVSKHDSGIENTDKELMDNPKLDELLTVEDTDECFKADTRKVIPKTQRSAERSEYNRTAYERRDHRTRPGYDNTSRPERTFPQSQSFNNNSQNNWRGHVHRGRNSYGGWSRARNNTHYSQAERRQGYHTQPWIHHQDEDRRKRSSRRPDDLGRAGVLDVSALSPEVLGKIQELIWQQK